LREKFLQFFRRKVELRIFSGLSFSLVWFLLFLIVPIAVIFLYSFWRQEYISIIPQFTIDNYAQFLANPIHIPLFLRSLGISAAVTMGSIGLAYPAAYFLAFRVRKYKIPLLLALMAPFWTSYLLIVYAWKIILGYDGILNSLLLNLRLVEQPVDLLLYSPFAVIITLIHIWSPWLVLPLYASLEKMDKSLLEAAMDLGATPTQAFLRVTLPLTWPALIVAVLFVFVPTVGEFVTPALVGGPQGYMYGNLIENYFHLGFNWPLGSSLAFVMLALVMVMTLLLLRTVGPDKVMESL